MSEKPNAQATTENFEFDALARAQNYRAALLREFAPFLKGRVIEVGAGVGQFTAELSRLPAIRELVAVEPESRFCEKLRTLLPRSQVVEGTFDALPEDCDSDAVVSVNVLEHIARDDDELAKYRARLAARSGHLCLFVPARPEIYAPLDKDFGHHRRYTRPQLRPQLERAGFSIVRLHYFNCVGYFAWWFNFCLLKKRRFEADSVALFDRVIFPVVHALEGHVVRPPFGQSLLAVARAQASR
jgi:SAM-dependent methyltransferase